MMRIALFVYLMFAFTSICYSQNNSFFRLGLEMNINVYGPYTSKSNIEENPSKVKSNTFNAGFDFRVFQLKRFSIYLGAAYKRIGFTKIDAISSSTSGYGANGQIFYNTYVYKDKPDLIATSNSFGASLETSYIIKSSEKYNMSIGLRSTFHFLELYQSHYYSSDTTNHSMKDPPSRPFVSERLFESPTFFSSSINTQLIYRVTIFPENSRATLTGKVSLGTNLFSAWEEFKRYAWVGVGLEIGFLGKKKN